MCFRPADANAPTHIDCPNCGKRINYTNGVLPNKCPFCKTPTAEMDIPAAPAPGAPSAPAAPGAPVAPGAPSAPAAPGAPKPPAN